MTRTVLSFSVENLITVGVMVFLFSAAFGLGLKILSTIRNG